jgi:hypothetical protein
MEVMIVSHVPSDREPFTSMAAARKSRGDFAASVLVGFRAPHRCAAARTNPFEAMGRRRAQLQATRYCAELSRKRAVVAV